MALSEEALETAHRPEHPSGPFSPHQLRPEGEISQPRDFQTLLAHVYDSQTEERKPVARTDSSGRITPGAGANARTASPIEILDFFKYGVHLPPDAQQLKSEEDLKRESGMQQGGLQAEQTRSPHAALSIPEQRTIVKFKSARRERQSTRRQLGRNRDRGGRSPQNHNRR